MEKKIAEQNIRLLCSQTSEKESKSETLELKELVCELEFNDKQLRAQIEEAKVFYQKVKSQQIQLESAQKDLKEASRQLQDHAIALRERDKEIENLRRNLKRCEDELNRSLQEINYEKTSKATLLQQMKDLKEEVKQLKGMLAAMRQDNQRLQNLLLE